MPAPVQEVLVTPSQTRIKIRLEPAQNNFHSLLLLAKSDDVSGFGEWVTETLLKMTAMERRRHKLVMIGFFYAVQPGRSWPSFPAYVDHLDSLPPIMLRDKLMNAYLNLPCQEVVSDNPVEDLDEILASEETYLEFLSQRFSPEHVDAELEAHAFAYVIDPASMHTLVVSHLRTMWEKYLAIEWERTKPMLKDAVAAFEQVDFSEMSQVEAAEFITGQSIGEGHLRDMLDSAANVVYVPSAHVGAYLGQFRYDQNLGIVFGARLPEGVQYYAPDLSRAELLVRLGALADDTRLRILHLIAERGEMRSPEIMRELDLSQSAASRHLKQLSATGYLIERRCEGAKCYDINLERIDNTLRALSAFLR